jgi:hypothetical protein
MIMRAHCDASEAMVVTSKCHNEVALRAHTFVSTDTRAFSTA